MRTELVTSLGSNAEQIIARLGTDHDPVLLMQHGEPAAYLVDVEEFDALNQRIENLEGIARGERDVAEGRLFTHEEVEKRMAKWLK